MLLSYDEPILQSAEAIAGRTGDVPLVLARLRELPFDDFGALLLSLPNRQYPHISDLLPRMADAEVQRSWTGADGSVLLRQTLSFVRLLVYNFQLITGRPLERRTVLDYGCGWGRIIRLMYYFVDPAIIYGCDPWDKSIATCEADGVLANLAASDYLPHSLPFAAKRFDLIYAFSVFTHLSERAMQMGMRALHQVLSDDGVLAITVRPKEYWVYDRGVPAEDAAALEQAHASHGYAFRPHNREPIDGEVTYGDASISVEYISEMVPDFKLNKIERSLEDPYQLILFLSKRRHGVNIASPVRS
jgi:SAM-dependent methyltransferase